MATVHVIDGAIDVVLESNVLAIKPRVAPRAEHVSQISRILGQACEERGGMFIVFVAPPSGLPSNEARAAIQQLLKAHAPRLHGLLAVIDGAGFAAAAKRSVLTFLTTVVRGAVRVTVCASITEAASELARAAARLKVDVPPQAVILGALAS